MADARAFLDELIAVRKGRGMCSPHVSANLGPALRRTWGIERDDSDRVLRQKAVTHLRPFVDELPKDDHYLVAAALGLAEDLASMSYIQRLAFLADRYGHDDRTMRRRADAAMAALAVLLAKAYADLPSWRTQRLSIILRLGPRPVCLEERTIIALDDNIQDLTDAQHDFDVLYGATRALRLPHPLKAGDTAEYGLFKHFPDGQTHYVYVPAQPCPEFNLRIRFAEPPLRVTSWDGTDELQPDAVGEVGMRFTDLTPGVGYGIKWEPALR
ncbi:hypothetical protein [Actinocrispum sp. NPDC049592]|uniref:hypothetical protein n=1 Tax=Actinocrispum sp. NPDC049592 TaxID=3154835 RepID=UPI00342A3A45